MRELTVVGCVALALGCQGKPPQADPAQIEQLARKMIINVPVPGAARNCSHTEVTGGATLTERTVRLLAKQTIDPYDTTLAAWINPPELDSPAASTLLDAAASETKKREAAAELLAAPFYLVYQIDNVSAPLAVRLQEMKRGSAGARALRYDKNAKVECLMIFDWVNDDRKSRQAFAMVEKSGITDEVVNLVREDLREQLLARVRSLALPPQQASGR